ncbi:DUF2066 domain-containing protein [Spongiibacter taiwanensis]|uniref:DUF2066 domain-containing protein n=1 Tax=Spongiibacter taiwanensis TaxID=1748242 RepID=UPI002034C37B|nr:DUF2066 domain-containing protein [Spongiibacter taiwanensis]USA43928.1 DUF2066 domain-containing protein [Spongiibacter taiwanensis]
MSRRWIHWLALFWTAWLSSGAVDAAVLRNLYDERLTVEEQSAQSLRRGAGEALERVLIKVSGQRQVRGNPQIDQALSNAEPLLTQYRYLNKDNADGEAELQLELSFSPRQVNALLQSAGYPVWSNNRPSVLVWLVEDTINGREFVSGDSPGALYDELLKQADRRGVALQFPLMDITDAANLDVDDVWQMQLAAVRAASARYDAPYILVGRASEFSSGRWVASWTLVQRDDETRLDSDGATAEDMLTPIIDSLADTQARSFGVVAGGDSESTLVYIDDIRDFHAYAGLVTYLENLAVVEHANPVWVSDNALVIELLLKGNMEMVERFLALDGQLKNLATRPALQAEAAALPIRNYYRWQDK